ncbi:MAG: ParB/RepB/Spo0J family partition protein [Verrucomicrobia bacterium]|nr:ParB/RepB/Spo0J family partition protein [Verrucomicrobiota bacterium]
MSKPALGRGLGALMGGGIKSPFAAPSAPGTPAGGSGHAPIPPPLQAPVPRPPAPAPLPPGSMVRKIARDRIRPSALQPRKEFPQESLAELADSIREQGIIQPLVVRVVGDFFELIAGERRWRAAGLAGLTEVPVIERVATDLEVLELALIENLQRENLNPIDEALGYQQLMTQFFLTQEQVGKKVGRGRVVVANATRLLKLPATVQEAVRDGGLSVGHAKVILGVEDPQQQEILARLAMRGGWTVRQLEAAIAKKDPATSSLAVDLRAASTPVPVDPHLTDLENRIRDRLGLRIALHYKGGKGRLDVQFNSNDELDHLLEVLGVTVD